MNFPGITIQGNIVSSEILEKIRTEDIKYQSPADFNLDRKTSVRDEIGIAWAAARAHYTAFRLRIDRLKEGETGTSETRNSWIIPLLRELGYNVEKAGAYIHPTSQKSYAISHHAANLEAFPIHIMGFNDDLDKRRETGGPRLSPHALVQEYLNNTDHVYALVTNGRFLRLLRDATRLVRISYLEFNLEKIMEEELYSDFAIFFRLLHATRMPQKADDVENSFIEYYHQESLASGSRIREKLSKAVEDSIKELANGFLRHPKNSPLREQIAGDELKPAAYYLYQLRLIYRLLFLIVTEERNLVFPDTREESIQRKRDIYYRHYSIERLRKLASRQHFVDGRKQDLWEGLKATFLLFEKGYYGNKLGIMPLGSGIFSYDALGLLPELKLDNESLLQVIRYLTLFRNDQQQWVRVNYSDLDVEEFGSVYEGLLEYDAVFIDVAGQPVFDFRKGTGRSSSGSHYTPEELVKPLIKHSLDYIIEDKLKEADREAALLSLTVCDVACGSGHILLSAARRIATELAIVRTGEEQPSPTAMRKATRDVIRNCIYGVDKNPLAVELCKVALWLESHNPGEPLSFLDHKIKCGDAIVGLAHREELNRGIPNEAFKTLPGDDKEIAAAFLKQNKEERKTVDLAKLDFDADVATDLDEAIGEYAKFRQMPERTPEEIELKQKAYLKYEGETHKMRLQQLADAQVAQFFIPKTLANKDKLIKDLEYRAELHRKSALGGIQNRKFAYSTAVAADRRFFHWFLEFPEVFNDGGFDCILGNPPYLGGKKLSGAFGLVYLNYIIENYYPAGGQSDLIIYFLKRIFSIINDSGFCSIITTSTISQGDTRENGLEIIIERGGVIVFALPSIKWPGKAKLEVTLISIKKSSWKNSIIYKGKEVKMINAFLDPEEHLLSPNTLMRNSNLSFKGSYIGGLGFTLTETEANFLIEKDRKNKNVIFPYLTGGDISDNFIQSNSRWVINFFNWPIENAIAFKDCFEIVQSKVKPERDKANRLSNRERWWVYAEDRPGLYKAISRTNKVIGVSQVTKYLSFNIIDNRYVFDTSMIIFPNSKYTFFAILQSNIHEIWARKYSSTLESRLRYTPTDAFETFPFPVNKNAEMETILEKIGDHYDVYRKQLLNLIRLGLTKIYNVFHDPNIFIGITSVNVQINDKKTIEKQYSKEIWSLYNHLQKTPDTCSLEEAIAGIVKLRELHVEMDNAVLNAYGWSDIKLKHDFYEVDYLPENDRVRYTIHPEARREILKRLLELNHQYFEQEAREGLHKEETVRKFYEQKGIPILEEVSKWFKKVKMVKKEKKVGKDEGVGDLFEQEN